MKRRSLLAALLARPQFAQPLKVHYRQPPPYESFRPLIDAPAMPVAPPRPKPANAWFADVTGAVLDSEQLSRGIPYWTARLDPATGIDIYGNNGIAVGDIDNDGVDEIYVCQPAGLPNRLFKWTNAKLVEISAAAGLDLLDNSVGALFLDLRNLGRQDLVLMSGGGPVLFLNDGAGKFKLAPDAFRFAAEPAGTFTGLAAADYDRDGKLDVYCCCYSFFQSEAQYRYPSPYHDAQNGPPNFLFRNRLNADGSGFFEDVTAATGLNANNNRFSFAPAWCDYDDSGWPSLYVANDFGRNNLYRNRGGKFEDVAAAAGVEDIGPGMSTCWFDEDGDGRPDLYVANMHSEAGQRMAAGRQYESPELKEAYRRHTKGNSLYLNRGNGRFEEMGAQRGVEMGRWAWSADAHDFDNDGVAEIYITCGMLTGERQPDLMSFFWNHVVAASPTGSERSVAYENAWNAINQFVREGYSWSGHEPNVFYRRTGERYVDASAESGLDVANDSRAFAVTDLDGDGALDVLLKSRLGPQLRVFQNRRGAARQRIGLVLQGTRSNRDAIGARVRVDGQTKWVSAGSGYLSQHTKTLHFGLGESTMARRIEVRWPNGSEQTFAEVAAGSLYKIVEGGGLTPVRKFRHALPIAAAQVRADNTQRLADTWFAEPVPLPTRHVGQKLLVLDAKDFADPDTAAAYSLFRRYLFEHRAELTAPLALLLNADGHATKIYAKPPTTAQVAADLKAKPQPLPYAGRWLSPGHRDFFKLGAALLSCGYGTQALPYLEAVLRREPANLRTRVLAAQVHREAGRSAEARRQLDEVLARDAQSAEAWNEMGGVAQGEGNDKRALECFERAIAITPTLTYALINTAQTCSRLQRHADAERYYARVLALDAKHAEAHNGLGLAQAQQGRPREAEAEFRQAVALQPAFGTGWNNLGVLLLQLKREGEAEAVLREGIRNAPREEILYLNLGRVYVGRKDREGARRVMQELLKANPQSALAKKALADLGN